MDTTHDTPRAKIAIPLFLPQQIFHGADVSAWLGSVDRFAVRRIHHGLEGHRTENRQDTIHTSKLRHRKWKCVLPCRVWYDFRLVPQLARASQHRSDDARRRDCRRRRTSYRCRRTPANVAPRFDQRWVRRLFFTATIRASFRMNDCLNLRAMRR